MHVVISSHPRRQGAGESAACRCDSTSLSTPFSLPLLPDPTYLNPIELNPSQPNLICVPCIGLGVGGMSIGMASVGRMATQIGRRATQTRKVSESTRRTFRPRANPTTRPVAKRAEVTDRNVMGLVLGVVGVTAASSKRRVFHGPDSSLAAGTRR
jgi:hypothetical protein